MRVTAKLRYLRIAPRKVRLVADLIRGKSVEEAQTILNFTTKKAAVPLLKLLKSAIANAKNNYQLNESNLYVQKIIVDEGPKYKRWMPRARGTASEIQKKTSHIAIVLDEIIKHKKKITLEGIEKKENISEENTEINKKETRKSKFKPQVEVKKPKIEKGIQKMFRRKSF